MKKFKKHFGFIFIAVFASILGLGAFLANHEHAVESAASEAVTMDAESKFESMPLAARSQASDVTDQEINDYIASKDEDVLNFYQWFMDTYDWKHTTITSDCPFLEVYAPDEEGYVDYSASMPTINFKKGNVYLFNGYNVQSSGYKDYQRANSFSYLYNLVGSSGKYKSYSSCEVLKEELTDDMLYTWDNQRICSEINNRFQNKVTQVYSAYPNTYHEDYKKGDALIIVPTEDFALTMTSDQTILTKHPSLFLDLLVGKVLSNDYQAPAINGTVHLSVNVDNQPSIETILSYVQAIDETDGVVPIQVVEEETTYIPGEMAIGDYTLRIKATDSSSNTAYETILIHRFDSTKPTISGTQTYTINYNNDLTLEQIKAALSIQDNIDKDLTLNLVSDNFTANKNRLGTYQIVFNAKDRSNNTSDNFTVVVVVRNEGTPVITAPTEITISISKLLTLEEFKAKVRVVDGYDGISDDYLITGYEEYAGSYTRVGTNDITVSKTNSGNNTASATVRFIKIDDLKPVLYFNNGYFVMLAPGETFTLEQFKEQAAAVLNIDVSDIVSVEGTYDTDMIGSYDLMVCFASGEEENFRIFVGEEVKPDVVIEEPKKATFFDQVKDFYKNNATVAWSVTCIGIVAVILLVALIVVIVVKKHK